MHRKGNAAPGQSRRSAEATDDAEGPGVSVVVPAFNRAGVISRAIHSVLRQSLQPLEILVVDDGSSDGTGAVVQEIAARDGRIRLLSMDVNKGGSAARNLGVEASVGEIVAFLDSDDEWMSNHLERKLALISRNREAALVCGSFHVDNGRNVRIQKCSPFFGDPLEFLFLRRGSFRTSTFVAVRSLMANLKFDTTLRKHQDWDFVIELLKHHDIVVDEVPTAILHISAADRISARLDHEASRQFYAKHEKRASLAGRIMFTTIMLARTYMAERRSDNYRYYLSLLSSLDRDTYAFVRRVEPCLFVPGVGRRAFLSAVRRYVTCRKAGR